MKFFILITLLLVVAALSNPDRTQHDLDLRKAMERLDRENNGFLDDCDLFDFEIFSMVRYMDATISVGLFGHVFVQYDELELSLEHFEQLRSKQLTKKAASFPIELSASR